MTRRERAENVKKRDVFNKYGEQARAVLDALLAKYADQGVFNLDDVSVLRIPPLTALGTPVQLINAFGGKDKFVAARPRPASRALPGDRVARVRPAPSSNPFRISCVRTPAWTVTPNASARLCWMFFLKIIDDQDQELELMQSGYKSPIPKRFQWRDWAADPEGVTGDALLAFINNDLFPALKKFRTTGQPGDRSRVVRDVFEDAFNYMKSGQLMRQVVNKINGVDFNNLTERQHFGDIYEQILNDLQSAGNAGEYYTPRAVTAFMADRIDPKPGETLFDPACGTGGFLTCSLRHMRDRYVTRPKDERKMQAALRAAREKTTAAHAVRH